MDNMASNRRTAPNDPLLTTQEVASLLRVSPGTLSNWRNLRAPTRTIPYIRVGGAVRYRRSAVDDFLRDGECEGAAAK